MQDLRKIHAFVAVLPLAGLGACASSPADESPPTGQSDIEVRHTAPVVNGNVFQCTGTWPSALTPCGYNWSSQPRTDAVGTTADAIELIFGRVPIPTDGGASTVYLKIKFAPDGTIGASAMESTTSYGNPRVIETSNATSGFVDPAVMGRTPGVRNAGTFSLTFPWGSISGSYDTAQ
jgi:hypothetical protein